MEPKRTVPFGPPLTHLAIFAKTLKLMSNSKSLFALALIALTACQSTNTNVADSNVTVITANLNKSETVSMKDIFSRIEIIELEEGLEAFVDGPRWFRIVDGKYYLDNRYTETICVFDSDGRFLYNTQKRIGNGHNEYQYLGGFNVCKDGCIDIYSATKGFFRYDPSLQAVARDESLLRTGLIRMTDDIVAFFDSPRDSLKVIYYSLSRHDTIGTAITPCKENHPIPFALHYRLHSSFANDSQVLYRTCKEADYSIYRLDVRNDTIYEAYRYDLGKNMMKAEDIKNIAVLGPKYDEEIYKFLNTYNSIWDVHLNNKFMLAVLGRMNLRDRYGDKSLHLSFYSLQTGEHRLINTRMKDGQELFMIDYLDDEALYTLFENREMDHVDHVIDMDLLDEHSKEILKRRTLESNMYIIKYYLK